MIGRQSTLCTVGYLGVQSTKDLKDYLKTSGFPTLYLSDTFTLILTIQTMLVKLMNYRLKENQVCIWHIIRHIFAILLDN